MGHILFRMGLGKFEDLENFPDGFVESGLFTDEEEELLTYWGETMYGLEIGNLVPKNEEEAHFIRTIDKPELAKSSLEKVWLKYQKLRHCR